MPLYRPTAVASLTVPVLGATRELAEQAAGTDTISVELHPRRVSLERNDHLTADECEIEVPFDAFGLDPRLLTSGTLDLWMGDAGDSGHLPLNASTHRFVGPIIDASRKGSDSGNHLTIKAHDNTRFFIDRKPFPTDGYPPMSATLREAWRIICANTGYASVETGEIVSVVEQLRDRLVFSPDVPDDLTIGKAMPARIAKQSAIQPVNGEDAWSLWQRLCLSLGLVSFIDRGDVVVASSTDFWSVDSPAAFLWGRNVLEFEQERRVTRSSETGIRAVSQDPATGATIEALFPPIGDKFFRKKRSGSVVASAHKGKTAPRAHVEKYRTKLVPWVTDPARLLEVARTYWFEEARQEFEIRFSTSEMRVASANSDFGEIDILALRSGDSIAFRIEDFDLAALPKGEARVRSYLIERGYHPGIATIMARSHESLAKLSSAALHIKTMRAELEATPEGGRFDVQITAHNLIDVTGTASA